MFGNCFTPKPARSGATAQLSVVDHKSQKFTESYPNAQPKASSVVSSKPTSHVSGGQDLVRKLSESAEKRCVLRSAHKHNPVQMAEEDVSTRLRLLKGQTYDRNDCCTLLDSIGWWDHNLPCWMRNLSEGKDTVTAVSQNCRLGCACAGLI